MTFVGSIQAQLKGDTADFRTKMAEAGQAVESFESKAKKFGLGFGGVALLATAFRAIVDHSRDLNGPLDENQRRAKAFALSLDEAKQAALGVGVQVMGVVNGIGEWIGRQVSVLRYGEQQVALSEQIAKDTEETLARIEGQKKAAEEILALRRQTAEVEARGAAEAEKRLDIEQQWLNAVQKLSVAESALAAAGSDKLAAAKAELEVAEARNVVARTRAELEKENAAALKKATEEQAKDRAEAAEYYDQLLKEELDTLTEGAAILKQEEATKRALIAAAGQHAAAEADVTQEMRAQLATLNAQKNAGLAGLGDLQIQRFGGVEVGRPLSRDELLNASDAVLRDIIARANARIKKLQDDFGMGATAGAEVASGGALRGVAVSQISQERWAAAQELEARAMARQRVQRFGQEGASRFYQGGGIAEFERLLQYVAPKETTTRIADRLDEIAGRMEASGLFPARLGIRR